ncbi:MAG: response regulator transcription factor [Spirochaetales bacterium]|nr:response regulator transcription factor [Spirochaetales bacterium]
MNTKEGMGQKELISFVLGSPNLKNELIQYVVSKEFNCQCDLLQDIGNLNYDLVKNYKKKLFLINNRDASFEYVIKFISTNTPDDDSFILALFNLHIGSGLEHKALGKKIKGFFYTDDKLNLFLRGVQTVIKGEFWVARDILLKCAFNGFKQKIFYIQKQTNLTEREIEILQMISLGVNNEEIADKMFITPNTVKTHLYNIYKKIKVKNRLQAALWAVKYL